MSFDAPQWLWALLLLPLLLLGFIANARRSRILLQKLVAERLQSSLASSVSQRRRGTRFGLLLGGLAACIVALARPVAGYTWEEGKRQGRDIIIAMDTSKSMLATDLEPSRLERAKLAAQDLIDALPGDRVGIIAFAGTAFLQAPVTIDYNAILETLRELDTTTIPQGGTNIAEAIRLAQKAFGKGEGEEQALIIFTDGEELQLNAVEAARKAAGQLRIFTVGVGTSEGSMIPVNEPGGGGNFIKDAQGNFVKSRLDESRLREIAAAGGGFYVTFEQGSQAIKAITERGLAQLKEKQIDVRKARKPIDRFQYPLIIGIVLLMVYICLSERRSRNLAVLLASLFLLQSGYCKSGNELYRENNFEGAEAAFEKQLARSPGSEELMFNLGAAAYKKGDFEKAISNFAGALASRNQKLRSRAQYNLANSLVKRGLATESQQSKLGDLRNAIQHYEDLLKSSPMDEDAKHNREQVKHLLEQLQKEPPKSQQQQKQEQQDQNDSKKQQEQSSEKKQNQGDANSGEQQDQKPGEQPEKQEDRKPGEQKSASEQQNAGKQGSEQKPGQEDFGKTLPERKFSGEIQGRPGEDKKKEQVAAQAAQVLDGQMSPQQATALLESLRADDENVPLGAQQGEPKGAGTVLKDW